MQWQNVQTGIQTWAYLLYACSANNILPEWQWCHIADCAAGQMHFSFSLAPSNIQGWKIECHQGLINLTESFNRSEKWGYYIISFSNEMASELVISGCGSGTWMFSFIVCINDIANFLYDVFYKSVFWHIPRMNEWNNKSLSKLSLLCLFLKVCYECYNSQM